MKSKLNKVVIGTVGLLAIASILLFSALSDNSYGTRSNPIILATPTITTTYTNGLIVTQDGAIVSNVDVTNPNGSCIQVRANNVIIDNVYVHGCKEHGIVVSGQNAIIRNSIVTKAVNMGVSCSSSVSWGSGIKGYVGATNLIVDNVNVYNNCGEGIAFTRVVGGEIKNSAVWDNFSVNIYVDNSYNILVEGNLATSTGNASYKRDGATARGIALGKEYYSGWGGQLHDVTVRRNVVFDAVDGIRIFQAESGVSPSGCINCLFEYNTVVRGSNSTGRALQIYGDSTNSNVIARYNILYAAPYSNTMTGITFVNNYIGSPISGYAWDNYASFTAASPVCNYGAIPCVQTSTPSITVPVTETFTATITYTSTITDTPTVTQTGTIFPSNTPTPSVTPTRTNTPTVTVTPSIIPTFCEETAHFRICTK